MEGKATYMNLVSPQGRTPKRGKALGGKPGGACTLNPLNTELNPICYLLALLELTIFSTLAG